MTMLGMPVEESGQPAKPEHRKHVHKLWPEFKTFVKGRNGGWFLSMLPAESPLWIGPTITGMRPAAILGEFGFVHIGMALGAFLR